METPMSADSACRRPDRVDLGPSSSDVSRACNKRPRRSQQLSPVLPARVVRKDMPPDMAGRCFNCLEEDHVLASAHARDELTKATRAGRLLAGTSHRSHAAMREVST
ncbi:hypothetical protein BRADI_4g25853v3 [Brachypodium distachyon]|uniref:Uncharacterized protein n=1 Tax=Brachypodium distachyon TaxID=15368 RepID=A0A0Q3PJ64_BRADI|nr:hypothetical protein BRADI_4g25853v3 [Brachypodium distachyon]